MKTDQEKIEVMQAHLRGEKIECKNSSTSFAKWEAGIPLWNWPHCDYRIAPKAPRRVYINLYPDGELGGGCWPSKSVAEAQAQGFSGYKGKTLEFVEVLP